VASFDTLLVANRGEIACRIIRSASALGLRTVAIFSESDRAAPHVRLADAAVAVGASPPRESYLAIEKVIAAARATGAGAIHPGYGFLSESEAFATAIEEAGLTFVGPTIEQLRVFGQKHTARAAATAAGVALAPGSDLVTSAEEAIAEAERIGWPVMLKATSGGGGIGMQACRSADELAAAFDTVTRLATASFGAGGVFVEALVERARHVEVQLFGDGRGQVLALGDRDCTLQRRNQKVIEEAPAPALSAATRQALHSGALSLGRAVRYRSAGTVEYVYDADREQAYFLEVNTRLQVEHGVT
jgi:urea carboxylase